MLSAFQLENNRLTRLEADEIEHLASSVWVDLVEPDDEERNRVQKDLGQNLATRPELEDIEASARFLKTKTVCTFTSFYEDADDHAGNSTVAFTIREGRLFTLRERELPAFACTACVRVTSYGGWQCLRAVARPVRNQN
jgi:magnesium transporter